MKNLADSLDTFSRLNFDLMTMSEAECQSLLWLEHKDRNRPRILLRIHSRYNALRAKRERLVLGRGEMI